VIDVHAHTKDIRERRVAAAQAQCLNAKGRREDVGDDGHFFQISAKPTAIQ